MNENEFNALVEKVGKEAATKIKKEMESYETKAKQLAEEAVKNGGVTKDAFDEYKKSAESALAEMKGIAEKQGTTLAELTEKVNSGKATGKSIAQVLKEAEPELKRIYQQGSGAKTFMVHMKANGQMVMRPYDETQKAAGPHATIDGVGDAGNVASITQDMAASTLLRIGGNAPIISQFRNTPWIFDLCRTTQAGFDMPFAIWFEEQPKQGSSDIVAEGAAKPLVQYSYKLRSAEYKKEASLIGITQEFNMDFARLESDIMTKGRIDVTNRMNTSILANITAAATAYNTGAQFKGADGVPNVNDFDALAAMAAQVDNATFGNLALGNMSNAAIMSTFKKYRMGITKSTQGEYLNRPEVLAGLNFVGNPDMGDDSVIVGDFTKYNIILRGGFLVKVGYNGNDFAENRFSVVMEQFYYDYISDIMKSAIVKGPDFATVKTAIAA